MNQAFLFLLDTLKKNARKKLFKNICTAPNLCNAVMEFYSLIYYREYFVKVKEVKIFLLKIIVINQILNKNK